MDEYNRLNSMEPVHLSEQDYKIMVAKLADVVGALIALNSETSTKMLHIIGQLNIEREDLIRVYLDAHKGENLEEMVKSLFGNVDVADRPNAPEGDDHPK